MKYGVLAALMLALSADLFGQSEVQIGSIGVVGGHAASPSIAIDAKDHDHMLVACGPDYLFKSLDGGQTWLTDTLTSSFGSREDLTLITAGKNDFFCFHLSDQGGTVSPVIQRSTDGGDSWSDGVMVEGAGKECSALQAFITHKGDLLITWTESTRDQAGCKTNVMFSQSGNGKSWSKPLILSGESGGCDDQALRGSMPGASADGKIVVTWLNGNTLYLDRSYDKGSMWLNHDIDAATLSEGTAMKLPGIGTIDVAPLFAVNSSMHLNGGILYFVWADQNKSTGESNVWFVRSVNYGDIWSPPQQVDAEAHGDSFAPTIAVDKSNGSFYIVYLSQDANGKIDARLASTVDSGYHFRDRKLSEESFDPDLNVPIPDHMAVDASDGRVVAVWTEPSHGKLVLKCVVLNEDDLLKK